MLPDKSQPSPALSRLMQPIDPASIAFFRMALGLLLAWEASLYLTIIPATGRTWIVEDYVVPQFLFKYFGFEWVQPLPGNGMNGFAQGLLLVSLMFAFGVWYRFSAVLLFLGYTYVFLLDQAQYLNHMYLVCLLCFLMIFIPADRCASVPSWLNRTKMPSALPAWTIGILRFQLAVIYIFAAVAKLNGDWLRGEPIRRWLLERANIPVLGLLFTEELVVYLFAYGGFLIDLLIVPLLLWRRTRLYAFAVLLLFHVTNAITFNIGIFPWVGIATATLFFDPSWPRQLLGRIKWLRPKVQPVSPAPDMPIPGVWMGRVGIIGLSIYVVVQLAVPLRHHLYPGKVDWTYEGHRFSWRMKLNDRRSVSQYTVTRPRFNQSWVIDPKDYLTKRQYQKLGARPDMILQFAHHLAKKNRVEKDEPVIVTARIVMSLNGRPQKPLVDPSVNLADEPRTLGHARWVLLQEIEPVRGEPWIASVKLE